MPKPTNAELHYFNPKSIYDLKVLLACVANRAARAQDWNTSHYWSNHYNKLNDLIRFRHVVRFVKV